MEISDQQLEQIKIHLRVSNNLEDDLIRTYAEGAVDYVELYCDGVLVESPALPEDGKEPPREVLFTNGIWQAMLLLIGHWYANREAVAQSQAELPLGVDALLFRHRRYR